MVSRHRCQRVRTATTAIPETTPQGNATTCNGENYFYAWYGTIVSPDYPSAYSANMNCSWTVQILSDSYVLNLTFTDFHLETSYDYLTYFRRPFKQFTCTGIIDRSEGRAFADLINTVRFHPVYK